MLVKPHNHKYALYLCCLSIMILASCSPSVSRKLTNQNLPLPKGTEIIVFTEDEAPDLESILVGTVKVGDGGLTTKCDYEDVLALAKSDCRKYGANILKITKLKTPNLASTCYRLEGEMRRNVDEDYLQSIKQRTEAANKSTLPEDADYALIHFYRPKNYNGSLIAVKVRDQNNEIIGRVRNGTKMTIKVNKFEILRYVAFTEAESDVLIETKPGGEYYVRCTIDMGLVVGRPDLDLVSVSQGRAEMQKIDIEIEPRAGFK